MADPQANFLTLNSSVARLGRRGARQRESEKERRRDHTAERETKTPRKGLAFSEASGMLYIAAQKNCHYEKNVIDCDVRVVSKVRK